MNRQLKEKELNLLQREMQLKAEGQLFDLDLEYQESITIIQEQYALEVEVFNATVKIELEKYPEPIKEEVKDESKVEETT